MLQTWHNRMLAGGCGLLLAISLPARAVELHGVLTAAEAKRLSQQKTAPVPKPQTTPSKKHHQAPKKPAAPPKPPTVRTPWEPVVRGHEMPAAMFTGVVYPGHMSVGLYAQNHRRGGIGVFDWFEPFWETPYTVAFWDMRVVKRKGVQDEENLGVGVRHLTDDQQWVLGAYGFLDRRFTSSRNTFFQTTLGAELKSERFSLNANFYKPFGKTEREHSIYQQDVYAEPDPMHAGFHNIWFSGSLEKAYDGGDFQVGYTPMPGLSWYVGGYHFSKDGQSIKGPLVRMTYDLPMRWGAFQKLTFETDVRRDTERGTLCLAGIRARTEFGPQPVMQGAASHLLDDVWRDIDIQTEIFKTPYQEYSHDDGTPVTVKFVNTAADLSASADVLLVEQDISGLNAFQLQDGQLLLSGDYQFMQGSVPFTLKSRTNDARAALTAASGQDLVRLGKNNTIRNIELDVEADSGKQSITNTGGASELETLTLDNVRAHGLVSLTQSDGVADIRVRNSSFNSGAYLFTGTLGDEAAFDITASGSANVTVSEFTNNIFAVTGNGVDTKMTGLANRVTGDGQIAYTAGLAHDTFNIQDGHYGLYNTVNASGGTASLSFAGMHDNAWSLSGVGAGMAGIEQWALNGATLTYTGAVTRNQFAVTGTTAGIAAWRDTVEDAGSTLSYQQGIQNNTFTLGATGTGASLGRGWHMETLDGGHWSAAGGVKGNTLTVNAEKPTAVAMEWVSDGAGSVLDINGFQNNVITVNNTSSEGHAEGTRGVHFNPEAGGVITQQGDVSGNQITITTEGNNGVAWYDDVDLGGVLNYEKSFANNTLQVDGKTSGTIAYQIDVGILHSILPSLWNAKGTWHDNTLRISGNTTGAALAQTVRNAGKAVWFDAVTNNQFKNDASLGGFIWDLDIEDIDSTVRFKEDVSNNVFSGENFANLEGLGWKTKSTTGNSAYLTFDKAFSHNQMDLKTGGQFFNLESLDAGDMTFTGGWLNNTFHAGTVSSQMGLFNSRDSLLMNGFHGNQFSWDAGSSPTLNFSNESGLVVHVLQDTMGLRVANGNVPVQVFGSPTITPGV